MLNYNLNINSPLQQNKKNEDVRPTVYWDYSSITNVLYGYGNVTASFVSQSMYASMSINAQNTNCIGVATPSSNTFTTNADSAVTASLTGSKWPATGSITLSLSAVGISYDPATPNQFISSTFSASSDVYNSSPSITGSILTASFNSGDFFRWYVSASITHNYNATTVTEGRVLYLDAGLTASYPGTGTTWFDLAPYQLNATLFNTAGAYTASNGGYFNFVSASQYAQVGHNNALNVFDGDYTLDVWYAIDANGTEQPPLFNDFAGVFSKPSIEGLPSFNYMVMRNASSPFNLANNYKRAAVFQNATQTSGSFGSGFTALGEFMNFQLVRSGSVTTGYSNLTASLLTTGSIVQMNNDGPIRIGRGAENPIFDYELAAGKIAVVMLYNRALNEGERIQNHLSIAERNYP
jgi:hypothetical protein